MRARIAPAPPGQKKAAPSKKGVDGAESAPGPPALSKPELSRTGSGIRDPTREENFLANVFSFGWGEDGRLGTGHIQKCEHENSTGRSHRFTPFFPPAGLGDTHEKNHPCPHPVRTRRDEWGRPTAVAGEVMLTTLMVLLVRYDACAPLCLIQIMSLHWRGDESRRVKTVACGGKHTLFVLNDTKVRAVVPSRATAMTLAGLMDMRKTPRVPKL